MGALASSLAKRIKQWFTGTPDEYNPTNDDIRNHHNMQEEEPPRERYPCQSVVINDHMPVNVDDTTISHSPLQVAFPSSSSFDHFSPPPQSLPLREKELIQPEQVMSVPSSLAPVHFSPPAQLLSVLKKGPIQPEVWPTKEEFQLAKKRIQYD